MAANYGAWSTRQELDFIMRLAESPNADHLLTGYFAGLHKRDNFGEIDVAVIEAELRYMLLATFEKGQRRKSAGRASKVK